MSVFEAGALLRETMRLMAGNAWRCAIAMALMTGIPVFADVGVDPRNRIGLDLVSAFMTVFFQTWLTVALLEAHGQRRGGRGVATVFGIGILGGLGVLLGLIVLIVPGLILLVRWSVSVPYALGEDVGVTDALRGSFEETRDAFWPILLTLLACYVPCALSIGAIALLATEGVTIVSSTALNVAINLGLLAGWHAAVAIYLARRRDAGLSGVFE